MSWTIGITIALILLIVAMIGISFMTIYRQNEPAGTYSKKLTYLHNPPEKD